MFSAKEAKEKSEVEKNKNEEKIFEVLKKDTEKAINSAIKEGKTSVKIKCESKEALMLVADWLNGLGFDTSHPEPYVFVYQMSIYWDQAE